MSDSTSRAARSRSRSRSPRMSFYIGSSSAEQDEPAGSSSSRRSDRGISHRSFHFDLDDLMSTFLSTRTPPVSQRTLLELQSLTIMQEQTDTPCSICFDDFKLAETSVRKLPCNHLYHERCIFPWLRINGTCPVCRARLPSADAGNDELVGDSTVTNFGKTMILPLMNQFFSYSLQTIFYVLCVFVATQESEKARRQPHRQVCRRILLFPECRISR